MNADLPVREGRYLKACPRKGTPFLVRRPSASCRSGLDPLFDVGGENGNLPLALYKGAVRSLRRCTLPAATAYLNLGELTPSRQRLFGRRHGRRNASPVATTVGITRRRMTLLCPDRGCWQSTAGIVCRIRRDSRSADKRECPQRCVHSSMANVDVTGL